MNNISIDINQRIPLNALHVALESYLNDTYNDEYILEQLRLEFKGENRLKKSLRIVNKIIKRNPIIEFIDNNKEEIKIAIKKKHDRGIILISMLNSSFPFSFDTLHQFGKFLSVQDLVNTEVIRRAMSDKYGGNRATINALYSVVPMFIEAGLIERPKTGVYAINDNHSISFPICKDIFIESFKINKPLGKIQEYQLRDPYFLFINV